MIEIIDQEEADAALEEEYGISCKGVDIILTALFDTCGDDAERATTTLALAVGHFLTQVRAEDGSDVLEVCLNNTKDNYERMKAVPDVPIN